MCPNCETKMIWTNSGPKNYLAVQCPRCAKKLQVGWAEYDKPFKVIKRRCAIDNFIVVEYERKPGEFGRVSPFQFTFQYKNNKPAFNTEERRTNKMLCYQCTFRTCVFSTKEEHSVFECKICKGGYFYINKFKDWTPTLKCSNKKGCTGMYCFPHSVVHLAFPMEQKLQRFAK